LLEFVESNIWLFLVAIASGVMFVWPTIAQRLSGAKQVGPLEAVQLINRKDAIVVDVREAGEFNAGHIVGARNFPLGAVEKRAADLQKFKTRPVVIVCGTGTRSNAAFDALKKLGLAELYVLAGGTSAWQQANLPTEK
jgi:rhodanese-related sulfurtransferase